MLMSGSGNPMIKLEACAAEPSRLLPRWLSSAAGSRGHADRRILLFTALGKDPWTAFHVFFVKPVATVYGVGELLLKATPLMLCASGSRCRLSRQRLEHRRRRPAHDGRDRRRRRGALVPRPASSLLLPLMLAAGVLRRHGVGGHSRLPAHAFQYQRNPASLMLVYIATAGAVAAGARRLARSGRATTSRSRRCSATPRCFAPCWPGTRMNWRFCIALLPSRAGAGCSAQKPAPGFRMQVGGTCAATPPPMPAFPRTTQYLAGAADRRCVRRAGRRERSRRPDRTAAAVDFSRATASPPSSSPSSADCIRWASCSRALLMSLLYLGGESAQIELAVAVGGHAACSRVCCCSICWRPTCSSISGCDCVRPARRLAAH